MAYSDENSHTPAADLIFDVENALDTLTLLFDGDRDLLMTEPQGKGMVVLFNSLRDKLAKAGAMALYDRDARNDAVATAKELERKVEAAHADAYAKGREDGTNTIMKSIEKIQRVVQPIIERTAAACDEQPKDGVYPHIGTPAPDIGAPSARCA